MPCEATGHSPVDKKDPVLLQPLSCPYSQKMIHTSATMRMSCRRKDRSDVCSESAPMHVYAACYQRHGLGSCVRRGMHASKGSRMPNGVFMMPVECKHAQQLVSPRPSPGVERFGAVCETAIMHHRGGGSCDAHRVPPEGELPCGYPVPWR